jgi:GT2 family glycosyltransferase
MAEEKISGNGAGTVPADGQVAALSGLVSILVPCCGMLPYTKLCVPSLLRHSRPPFELIFLDIGSLDGTVEYLAGLAAGAGNIRIEVLRTLTDQGIGEICKEAFRQARGEYLVLLNNDTVVTHGWLNALVNLANLSPAIGLVGPVSNYAAPPQLVENVPYRIRNRWAGIRSHELGVGSQGSAVTNQGSGPMLDVEAVHAFARDWHQQRSGQWLEAERLGGFCLLAKRQVLKKIGHELEGWTDLGLFDSDILSVKARQVGYTPAVCRDLFIHHFGTRVFAHGAPAAKETAELASR